VPRVLDAVSPVLTGLFCLPKVALLPLYVIFLGIGIASKVVLVMSVVVFLTLYSTIDGVRDVDPDLINSLRLMGASRFEILAKVIVPSTLPWVFTGLRIAVSYALTTTVVGELLSSNRGIGFLIESSAARFNSASVFAAVTVLVAVSVTITEILIALERRGDHTPAASRG
jgi:NitT/TauT family transport system permease protein